MGETQDLKTKLAAKVKTTEKAKLPDQPQDPAVTIHTYLKQMLPEIQRALPKHLNADRLTRIALTTMRTNPKLLECTMPSLLGAVMQAAQLGLEPGLIGHCHLVPFFNKNTGKKEVQFIIGYKGLLDLVRRSGDISAIAAHEVCSEDTFSFQYGLAEELTHKPKIDGPRGEPYAYYSYARFKDGGHAFLVMSREEVERYRDRFAKSKTGPWATDFDAMAKKTVLKQLVKYLPLSTEAQHQITTDESLISQNQEQALGQPIPITWVEEETVEEEPENQQEQYSREIEQGQVN